MAVDTIITGGTVVTQDRTFQGSVAIDGGTIVGVGSRESLPDAAETVDVGGNLVMPGFVDPHVHFDEVPSHRTGSYDTDTAAAAVGGVTTCIDFAWQTGNKETIQEPGGGTLLDGIEYKLERGADAIVDFGLHAALVREGPDVLAEMEDAVDAGVTSFKLFISGGEGNNYENVVSSKGFVGDVMEEAAQLGAVVAMHTEEPDIVNYGCQKYRSEETADAEWVTDARPDYAEAMAAEHALRLAEMHGTKYYGVHTTNRKAVEVIDRYQEDRRRVRAETCPHYLVLNRTDYDRLGTLLKVGPPIRTRDDNEAMIDYLKRGVLSTIGTDHCSFELDSKRADRWWDAIYGFNSIQHSAAVFHDVMVRTHGMSYPFMVRTMSSNVAETFGMPAKGTLAPGTDADIVIFDPDETYTIRAEDNLSRSEYSVYEGRTVTGRPTRTFLRGELIAEDGEVLGEPGYGSFVERELPDWTP